MVKKYIMWLSVAKNLVLQLNCNYSIAFDCVQLIQRSIHSIDSLWPCVGQVTILLFGLGSVVNECLSIVTFVWVWLILFKQLLIGKWLIKSSWMEMIATFSYLNWDWHKKEIILWKICAHRKVTSALFSTFCFDNNIKS